MATVQTFRRQALVSLKASLDKTMKLVRLHEATLESGHLSGHEEEITKLELRKLKRQAKTLRTLIRQFSTPTQ